MVGIVGALGLVHGINDALDNPARSGQIYDALVTPDSPAELRAFPAKLERLAPVDEIAHIRHGTANVAAAGLPLWDIEPVRGSMHFTLLSGRAPEAGEAAVGPSTAHALHLHIGDRVRVAEAHTATLRVSGIALLPESPHSSFDQGLWVSPATMLELFGKPQVSATDEGFVVTAKPGVSKEALGAALEKHITHDTDSVALPQDVVFLRAVRTLPIALAGFLVVLAVAAVGHTLATTVRRRRHELAVLQAIGLPAPPERRVHRRARGDRRHHRPRARHPARRRGRTSQLALGRPTHPAALRRSGRDRGGAREHPGHVAARQRARGLPGAAERRASRPPKCCAPSSRPRRVTRQLRARRRSGGPVRSTKPHGWSRAAGRSRISSTRLPTLRLALTSGVDARADEALELFRHPGVEEVGMPGVLAARRE